MATECSATLTNGDNDCHSNPETQASFKNNNPWLQQHTRLKHSDAGSHGNKVTIQWQQVMKMLTTANHY